MEAVGRYGPVVGAAVLGIANGIVAVLQRQLVGVPRFVIGVLPKSSHLVQVSARLVVHQLVTPRVGIQRDGPLLPLRVNGVAFSHEGCLQVGLLRVGVGEEVSVGLDEIRSLQSNLLWEHLYAVLRALLIFLSKLLSLFAQPRFHKVRSHHRRCNLNASFKVARAKSQLLFGELVIVQVAVDKPLFVPVVVAANLFCFLHSGERLSHVEHRESALSCSLHRDHPRANLLAQFGFRGVGQQFVGSIDESLKVEFQQVVVVAGGTEQRRLPLAAQSVPGDAQVYVILAEGSESLAVCRHQVVDGPLP